jgi:CRP-like cAMP-binding protein
MVDSVCPLEALAHCPLFAKLPEDDLAALAAIAQTRRYPKGAVLFWVSERPEGLHIVTEGCVKTFILSPQSGREVILALERPFAAVADLAPLDEGLSPASAQAVEPTTTLLLEQHALMAVLLERPAIALHLLRRVGRRLRRLVWLVEQLSFQEVIHRLAGYLLERAEQGVPFALETNVTIAAQLGTVPELVSRNLTRLQQAGAVQLERRTVERVDAAALRELAQAAGR